MSRRLRTKYSTHVADKQWTIVKTMAKWIKLDSRDVSHSAKNTVTHCNICCAVAIIRFLTKWNANVRWTSGHLLQALYEEKNVEFMERTSFIQNWNYRMTWIMSTLMHIIEFMMYFDQIVSQRMATTRRILGIQILFSAKNWCREKSNWSTMNYYHCCVAYAGPV